MGLGAYSPLPLRLGPHSLTAQQHSRLCADLVAVKRTMPLAVLTFGAFVSADIRNYRGMNGVSTVADYVPAISYLGSGAWQIDFQALWENEYEEASGIVIRHATAHSTETATFVCAVVTITGAAQVVLRLRTDANAATTGHIVRLTVW